MSDIDKKIGQKIRDIRLSKGITQRELAGDKITRNMLSLIESGNASPSISTFMYLVERLDTPAGYFFSATDEDEGLYHKLLKIDEIKECYKIGNYRRLEEIAGSIPSSAYDDELSYIMAVAYLHLATESAQEFDMRTAAERLATAEVLAANTVYCGEIFSRAVEFYSELFRDLCSTDIPDTLCDHRVGGEYVSPELVEYFRCIKLISQGEECHPLFPRGSYFERHTTALDNFMDGRVNDSLKKLRDLSADSALPYYMQFRVWSDLENAANVTGDVRIAYTAAKRKLELIEKCKVI